MVLISSADNILLYRFRPARHLKPDT